MGDSNNLDWCRNWSKLRLDKGRFACVFDKPPEKVGSIYLANTGRQRKDEAVVIAVGAPFYDHNGVFRECFASVGDKIIVDEAYGRQYRYFERVGDETVERTVHLYGFSDIVAIIE